PEPTPRPVPVPLTNKLVCVYETNFGGRPVQASECYDLGVNCVDVIPPGTTFLHSYEELSTNPPCSSSLFMGHSLGVPNIACPVAASPQVFFAVLEFKLCCPGGECCVCPPAILEPGADICTAIKNAKHRLKRESERQQKQVFWYRVKVYDVHQNLCYCCAWEKKPERCSLLKKLFKRRRR
ncbi:MAG: hypothetical protein AAF483_15335, partial [Planctomycetota bacterium]